MKKWLFLALVAGSPAPQEPAPAREKLVRSLEEKLMALGPLTAEFRFESQDPGSERTTTGTGRAHVRLAERVIYGVKSQKGDNGTLEEFHTLIELPATAINWSAGGEGTYMNDGRFARRSFRHEHAVRSVVGAFFGTPNPHPDEEGLWRSLVPVFTLDLDMDPNDPASPWLYTFKGGMGTRARASWLDNLYAVSDSDIAEGKDEITLKTAAGRRTVVIDRHTGFLRSIRLELADGRVRLLTVDKVEKTPVRPTIHLPEKIEIKRLPLESIPGRLAPPMYAGIPTLTGRILREWTHAGSPERAEALRGMLANVAALHESYRREAVHRKMAANLVKMVLGRGQGLDDLEKDLKTAASTLKGEIEKLEERERKGLASITEGFKDALLKSAGEAKEPGDAPKVLAERIREAFDPARLEKARARVQPPDAAALIAEEIAEAHAESMAPALLRLRRTEERAESLERRLAELESVSMRLRLENVDAGALQVSGSEIEFHVRPREGFGFCEWYRGEGDQRKLTRTLVIEGNGLTLSWAPGETALRLDQRSTWKSSLRSLWQWRSAVARLHGLPPPAATVEAYMDSCRPYLRLDAETTNTPKLHSTLNLNLVLRPDGGATWVDELRSALIVEYPEGPAGGVLRFARGRRTVEIEMRTGLLRSIRTEFPMGAQGSLKVVDVKLGGAKPAVTMPALIRTRVIPGENHAASSLAFLDEALQQESLAILALWDRFESQEGARTLRTFYAAAAATQEECWRERAWMGLVMEFVKSNLDKGKTLDDLEDRLDESVKFFEKTADRNREAFSARIDREMAKTRTRLIEGIRPLHFPLVVRKRLEEMIEENFQADRGKADHPKPNFRALLEAAIENARDKE